MYTMEANKVLETVGEFFCGVLQLEHLEPYQSLNEIEVMSREIIAAARVVEFLRSLFSVRKVSNIEISLPLSFVRFVFCGFSAEAPILYFRWNRNGPDARHEDDRRRLISAIDRSVWADAFPEPVKRLWRQTFERLPFVVAVGFAGHIPIPPSTLSRATHVRRKDERDRRGDRETAFAVVEFIPWIWVRYIKNYRSRS
jgi:hypothetical protein